MTQSTAPAPVQESSNGAAVSAAADLLTSAYRDMTRQLQRVIVGQQEVLDLMLLALFCQGHCLLEGAPGLAKTLMISSLSKLLSLRFVRIQFTPDLMPSDITGTEILQEDKASGTRALRFVRGPLFANMVLADEINRTPPKTQAALLQAMQEYEVTVAGQNHKLDRPFFVLGTQNPIESEGTYSMPDAQLDRFMFKIKVGYPTLDQEVQIATSTTGKALPSLEPVLTPEHILKIQSVVRDVIVAQPIATYAVRLVRATRPDDPANPAFVKQYVSWGAGPRACQSILLGAKAHALLMGRANVAIEDIHFIAKPVLRHRIIANFTAESENVNTDDLVGRLLKEVPENT